MRRRHYVIVMLLAAAGLAGSFFLITRGEELALIRYRDRDFAAALREYEARLAAGDFSPSLVRTLSQLYLQYGNVDAALALMERFVRARPDDALARRELSKYYQYAQRNRQYVEELETLARLDPSEDTLRRLSEIYNFQAQFAQQIEVLREIVRRYPGRPQDLLDLANLQASQGRVADAAVTLQRFHAQHREAGSADTMHFLLSTLLDTDRRDEALRHARAWLADNRDPFVAMRFASLLSFKGAAAAGLSILEPFADAAGTSPEILVELTRLEIANGLSDRARDRLARLDAAGRLPPAALETYLDVLLTSGSVDTALDVAERRDLSAQPPWILTGLVEAALAAGRVDVAGRLYDGLGEGFLADAPVLGARLALARGDRAGAERWAARATPLSLSADDAVALAQIHVALGRRAAAIALLRPLVEDPAISDQVVVDLSTLYLESDTPEAGLRVLEPIRAARSSPAVDAGWALLATQAGRGPEVVRWLSSVSVEEPADAVLDDLFFIAVERQQHTLAVAAGERRWSRRGGRAVRLELATALLAADRALDSLPHFRALMPGDADVESGYLEALNAARAAGAPVEDELRRHWAAKLATARLTPEARDEVLFALLDLDAYAAALPTLAELARREGGTWLFAYADAAVKAGRTRDLVASLRAWLDADPATGEAAATRLSLLREHGGEAAALPHLRRFAEGRGGDWAAAYEEALTSLKRYDELRAYWRSRGLRRDVAAAERRSIGFRSLESGDKALSEAIFRDLAAEAPADSSDVRQLLFLWGPRPEPAALDWLAARGRAATGEERQRWMRYLIDVGEPRRALAIAGGEYSEAYLDAVVATGDAAALEKTLAAQVPAATSPRQLRRLAEAALALGRPAATRAAYEKLLDITPDDGDALRRLGALDFAESRMADAKARLERYLAAGGADAESLFYYAEIAAQDGDRARAREYYERALAAADRRQDLTFDLRMLRALTLHRLGRADEAFSLFEALLRERPHHAHLRADYAASLIQSGRYDEARRVLDAS